MLSTPIFEDEMPSPKGYKREDVLDRAIELFRRNGYSATSTAELVDALGINRKSMYAEFGSKQERGQRKVEPGGIWGKVRVPRKGARHEGSTELVHIRFYLMTEKHKLN